MALYILKSVAIFWVLSLEGSNTEAGRTTSKGRITQIPLLDIQSHLHIETATHRNDSHRFTYIWTYILTNSYKCFHIGFQMNVHFSLNIGACTFKIHILINLFSICTDICSIYLNLTYKNYSYVKCPYKYPIYPFTHITQDTHMYMKV